MAGNKEQESSGIGAFLLDTNSVEVAYHEIIKRLSRIYCLLQPGKTVDDFNEAILSRITRPKDGEPVQIEFSIYAGHSAESYKFYMQFMSRSCFFCMQALIDDEPDSQSQAWLHIANAQYYLGLLEGAIVLEPALGHVISHRGKVSAKIRAEHRYGDIKKLAIQMAQGHLEGTKAEAARKIKDAIVAHSKTAEPRINLSESNAEKLLHQWLTGIRFGGKRKPRSKNVKS